MTSWNAGMAVPDWPLSFGGLNPSGWWSDWSVRLEHGHRLFAGCVAFSVASLCAAVWARWSALLYSLLASVVAVSVGRLCGVDKGIMAHLGIWPAALVFVGTLILGMRREGGGDLGAGSVERGLALGAFLLVCVQATLGGLRVTRETAGFFDLAQVLRIFHGCVAQAFLMVLVVLSVQISKRSSAGLAADDGGTFDMRPALPRTALWIAAAAVYVQLVLGAAMRHLGAGLAIPSFPEADFSGSWIPVARDGFTLLNFAHTRLSALVVALLVLAVVIRTARAFPAGAGKWLAGTPAFLVFGQVILGILVVQNQKPPTLTTLHVVMGAGLLASLTALAAFAAQSEAPGRRAS